MRRRVVVTGLATAVLVAVSAAGVGLAMRSSVAETPMSDPGRGQVDGEYPDLIVRELARRAREPRPVPNSAMPPRHLDAEVFPTSLVDRTRIVSGGTRPDGIPAIDDPQFEPASSIDWLADQEPVLVLQLDDHVRAYPIQVMMWHEIVNDWTGMDPVTITYCPLCNSGVAFDPRVNGNVLQFGTSGALYQSALVMYDRQTESLWTHFDGRAVVGTLVGEQLRFLPLSTVSWKDFAAAHPDAPVLTRDTGYDRPYGRNPYVGYDQGEAPLTGFFAGEVDDRLAPMTRVVGVHVDDTSAGEASVAVATTGLARHGVVTAQIDGREITIWHISGMASALHRQNVADGGDVGAAGVFWAEHEGTVLSFSRRGTEFVDEQTGSTWNVLGEAVAGPLAGERLEPIFHLDTFWFAWSAYRPDTVLCSPPADACIVDHG